MSLTNSKGLQPQPVTGVVDTISVEAAAEGTALALSATYRGPNPDWTYSETAESVGGTTVPSQPYATNLDAQPGLIYAGVPGASARVSWADVDVISRLPLTTEADDQIAVVLYRNNVVAGQSDEGFVAEMDTATYEANGSVMVDNLQVGDALRLCLVTQLGSEDGLDFTVSNAGDVYVGVV